MLHGDIANRQCPIIAFNLDNLLFTDEIEKEGLLNKVVYKFGSEKTKFLNRKTNDIFIKSLQKLWQDYNYSIYLVTGLSFTTEIEEKLQELGVCYTKLMSYIDLSDLRNACQNQCTYYFDSDDKIISYMSSSKACNFRELWIKVGKA